MDLKFKPLVSRSIPGIAGMIIIFLIIIISLIIGVNIIGNALIEESENYNSLYDTTESNIYFNQLGNSVKYISYTIIFLLSIGVILIPIITIGNLKNTRYNINNGYIEFTRKFISEKKITIPVNEVTNIDYSIGFFWDKIFGTGSILVSTAGSSGADMIIGQVKDVIQKYDSLNELLNLSKSIKLQENGEIYGTHQKIENKLIQRIKPNAGIYFAINLISTIFSGIFLGLYFLITGSFESNNLNVLLLFLGFSFITSLGKTTFGYFAYKKKYYDFYSNKLEYYDGFLTLNKSTIPFERITNIDEKRGILDRIVGTSTIAVETAGSAASEISISYVTNGEQIVQELKEVLKKHGRN